MATSGQLGGYDGSAHRLMMRPGGQIDRSEASYPAGGNARCSGIELLPSTARYCPVV